MFIFWTFEKQKYMQTVFKSQYMRYFKLYNVPQMYSDNLITSHEVHKFISEVIIRNISIYLNNLPPIK